jgi:stress response protein SCP2
MGDNKTGAGAGDDEVIKVDLEKVPVEVERIAFTVTIHEAEARLKALPNPGELLRIQLVLFILNYFYGY